MLKRLIEWCRSASNTHSSKRLRTYLLGCIKSKVISSEQFAMIDGVLQVSELQVRDCMIPRAQMLVIDDINNPSVFLPILIDSKHSRFPVVGHSKDQILGILLAKDLLSLGADLYKKKVNIETLLHQPSFVPESKRLDVLLNDFQKNHNHMAIVLDEYGSVSGLVTLEDVLEKIVGEIEDEYFVDTEEDDIKPMSDDTFLVKAATTIEQFNQYFKTNMDDALFDTLSGLIAQKLGRIPRVGDSISHNGFKFTVLRADKRCVRLFEVEPQHHEKTTDQSSEK
jgi:magnesium and cobalt transporter